MGASRLQCIEATSVHFEDPSVFALSIAATLQDCHVGVIALSDPADQLLYKDPIVEYDVRYDLDAPSVSILEAVHFMHKASYTHVIIQQVGATCVSDACLSLHHSGCYMGDASACPQGCRWMLLFLPALNGPERLLEDELGCAQEFGLMPIMWQLADLARWLDPVIKVYTVVHNPKAAPNVEERGILRAMSQVSRGMIVMTW